MSNHDLSNFHSEFWLEKHRSFDYFNNKLYKNMKIVCSDISYDEEYAKYIDGKLISRADMLFFNLVGACGGILLGIDSVDIDLNLKSRDFWDNIYYIIKNSSEYKMFLQDTNLGDFVKSDLFNAINNNIIIASNYKMGPNILISNKMMVYDSRRVSISCIRNEYDKDGALVGFEILGDLWGCDEIHFSITYLNEKLTQVIDSIYFELSEIVNDYLEGGLVNMPNIQHIRKPESSGEIINYKDYLGYNRKKIFYNEDVLDERYSFT